MASWCRPISNKETLASEVSPLAFGLPVIAPEEEGLKEDGIAEIGVAAPAKSDGVRAVTEEVLSVSSACSICFSAINGYRQRRAGR